ncbi:MAG: hypothetical protein HY905_06470 [Deltaproteobacteria bacterium]|nr:hypothetical protein [Deltaproteobacteria bacterium]
MSARRQVLLWSAAAGVALLAGATGCRRMRELPAHGTVRARGLEVFLDGLRPTLVADLRVEVIGALPGAAYDIGPAFAASGATADGGGGDWLCAGEACSTPVDTGTELYPVEVRYLLDQLGGTSGLAWPIRVRFEMREVNASGRSRLVEAGDEKPLDEACERLARVPLQVHQAFRAQAGAEGELTVEEARAVGGCEGPMLHLELAHRVMPLPGTAPVVRLAIGIPGFEETACRGLHCEVRLEPPDRGTAVIDKPLGTSLAALARPAARAQVHVYLERRPDVAPVDAAAAPAGQVLDHYVFDLVSPGAGVVP